MIDRLNRVLLALLGLLLLAGGLVVLLASSGVVSLTQPGGIYESAKAASLAQPGLWLTAVVVGSVVLAALSLWWALRQLAVGRTPGLNTVTVERTDRGRTTVRAVSVARAVAADLQRLPSVLDADARLVGYETQPHLLVRLDVPADADLASVQHDADAVYDRAGHAAGLERLSARTRFRLSRRPAPRVR